MKRVDWIKMKVNIDMHPGAIRMADRLDMDMELVVFKLYRIACWFRQQAKYGQLKAENECVIDMVVRCDGFSDAMRIAGYLVEDHGMLMLKTFCNVSAIRKSIGANLRAEILSEGKCRACGSTSDLVIDHNIPVSRGGPTERSNLIPLCFTCNSRKATRTLEEFKGVANG